MNKYFLILIILATVYYLQYNIIENFTEAEQSVGGVDDANAINTLAQLAKKLIQCKVKNLDYLLKKLEIDTNISDLVVWLNLVWNHLHQLKVKNKVVLNPFMV